VTRRPHAAVFLVRAWWEDGEFRARITYHVNIDATPPDERQIVTADPEELHQHLATWLAVAASAASSQ
jgi:hypothetical protein